MSGPEQHNIQSINLTERPTEAAHTLLRERVKPGHHVVAATLGNGHDTIFLADLVGPLGHVDSFDIQVAAIESTQRKLQDRSTEQVSLHHAGHETMLSLIVAPVQAVMFNLGYLPGADKGVITQAKTTIEALQASVELLSPDGIITIVAYIGHPGGQDEANEVTKFCRSLEQTKFVPTIHKSPLDNPSAPFLISIVRH